jgi:hypothetical protein
VVPVIDTAYTKPCALRQSCSRRCGGVTGVTMRIIARPCSPSARSNSALSSMGRSGTMKPQMPAAAASAASFGSP